MKEKLSCFISDIKTQGKTIYKQKYYIIDELMKSSTGVNTSAIGGYFGGLGQNNFDNIINGNNQGSSASNIDTEEKMYFALRYTTEAICLSLELFCELNYVRTKTNEDGLIKNITINKDKDTKMPKQNRGQYFLLHLNDSFTFIYLAPIIPNLNQSRQELSTSQQQSS